MKALITGVAGFIGSHVAEELLERGLDVVGIDDLSGGFLSNVPPGVTFEKLSINDPLDSLFKRHRPDLVYHLAAYAAEGLSHHIPLFNYNNNLIGTANVLSAAYAVNCRHFVFTSSIAAYGHPKDDAPFDEATPCQPCDPYGVAKFACEQHIKSFHSYFGAPSYTIFRPHNVFGPKQNISDPYRNVVGIFMHRALLGEPLPVFGDGSQTRSFSYIDSVARCIAAAPFNPAAAQAILNVGGDEAISVRDLAQKVSKVLGIPENLEFLVPRREVKHAHCLHERIRKVFPAESRSVVDIDAGLRIVADYVTSHPVPPPTECPCAIELRDNLPPAWSSRLEPALIAAK